MIGELDKLAQGNAAVTNAIGLLYLDAARYDEAGDALQEGDRHRWQELAVLDQPGAHAAGAGSARAGA